jgi:hypothetical protein
MMLDKVFEQEKKIKKKWPKGKATKAHATTKAKMMWRKNPQCEIIKKRAKSFSLLLFYVCSSSVLHRKVRVVVAISFFSFIILYLL